MKSTAARRMRAVLGRGAVLGLFLTGVPVAAQAGESEEAAPVHTDEADADPTVVEARERFRAATELERAERWSEATRELRAALELRETPGLRFHLAYCEERQGHYVEALTNYRRAKALIENGDTANDVAELVGPAVERVESQVAHLEVVLETKVERVVVRVDGRPLAPGAIVELNPGPHQLEVSAPGWKSQKRSLHLNPGSLRLPVLLTRAERSVATPPPEPEKPEPQAPAKQDLRVENSGIPAKTWALVVESVVLGGAIAAGIGFSLRADRAQQNANLTRGALDRAGGDCDHPSGAILEECAALQDFERSRDDAQFFSTVAFVGAGATASALIVTALLWPDRKPPRVARTVVPVGPRSSWGVTTGFEF